MRCTSIREYGRGDAVFVRVIETISWQGRERLFHVIIVRDRPPQHWNLNVFRIFLDDNGTVIRAVYGWCARVSDASATLEHHPDDVDRRQ